MNPCICARCTTWPTPAEVAAAEGRDARDRDGAADLTALAQAAEDRR